MRSRRGVRLEADVRVLRLPRWAICSLSVAVFAYFFWAYGASRVWVTDGGFGFTLGRFVGAVFLAVAGPLLLFFSGQLFGIVLVTSVVLVFVGLMMWKLDRVASASGPRHCDVCDYPEEGLTA